MSKDHTRVTSERYIFDIQRPDRRTPFKALVEKTYQFAHNVLFAEESSRHKVN